MLFWYVMHNSFVDRYQRFGEMYCFHLHGRICEMNVDKLYVILTRFTYYTVMMEVHPKRRYLSKTYVV
jgi:hypothetical protein